MADLSALTKSTQRTLRELTRVIPTPALLIGAWCVLILVVVQTLVLLGSLASHITLVIIPLGIAVLLAMLLNPLVNGLRKIAPFLPRGIAAILVVILFFGIAIVAMTFAFGELLNSAQHFQGFIEQSVKIVSSWLEKTPLKVDGDILTNLQSQVTVWVQDNWRAITDNALVIGSNVATMATGTLLLLFGLIFFLADGRKIWRWVVRLLPEFAEEPTYQAFRRGAKSLSSYVRTMILVACFDATVIGLSAFFLGVPLLFPIVILIFMGVFIPLVGPVLTGSIVILVALASKGTSVALILAIIVFVTQQVDANILQPLLLGNAVSLHPLAILISITIGSTLFGLIGMVFAVPVVALINSVTKYYLGQDPFPELGEDITLESD